MTKRKGMFWPIVQLILVFLAIGFMLYFARETFATFVQQSGHGVLALVLNGLVIAVFILGLLRLFMAMHFFSTQHNLVDDFSSMARDGTDNLGQRLPAYSIIKERFDSVATLHAQGGAVDQGALATVLATRLSSSFTILRFVQNILILLGVFGTIVSLALALVGASKLLQSAGNLDQMNVMIGGMSLALSTTITAIICYVVFSFFHLQLQDARAKLMAAVEEATTLYVLPRFPQAKDQIASDMAKLSAQLAAAAEHLAGTEERYMLAGDRMQLAVDDLRGQITSSSEAFDGIKNTLREGFRLPPASDE